jgi:hypothetical protein
MDAVALAAALARPWADVVLSGAATLAQLDASLKSLDVTWDAQAESEPHRLTEAPDAYWQTPLRSGLELNTAMRRRTRAAVGPAAPCRQPSNDRARRTVSFALSAEPFR